MDVKTHYDRHLAPVYSWMFGDFDVKVEENLRFFSDNDIVPRSNLQALDLGAGSGFQSIALAKLGFKVTAVDVSNILLNELTNAAGSLPIRTEEIDIVEFLRKSDISPELIICMGDTLTHLTSLEEIREVIGRSYALLSKGGRLIISYRDLSHELQGNARFIPVRSTDQRIFTCFLEYFPEFVKVHDIINEKEEDGWSQRVSSYNKLKIPLTSFKDILTKAGFSLNSVSSERGMQFLIAGK